MPLDPLCPLKVRPLPEASLATSSRGRLPNGSALEIHSAVGSEEELNSSANVYFQAGPLRDDEQARAALRHPPTVMHCTCPCSAARILYASTPHCLPVLCCSHTVRLTPLLSRALLLAYCTPHATACPCSAARILYASLPSRALLLAYCTPHTTAFPCSAARILYASRHCLPHQASLRVLCSLLKESRRRLPFRPQWRGHMPGSRS